MGDDQASSLSLFVLEDDVDGTIDVSISWLIWVSLFSNGKPDCAVTFNWPRGDRIITLSFLVCTLSMWY